MMEKEEEQQEIYNAGFNAARQQFETSDPSFEAIKDEKKEILNIFKLDVQEFLEDFKQYLTGKVLVYEGNKRVSKKLYEPAINEKGMSVLLQIVTTHINRHAFLSFLEPEMVQKICREINSELSVDLGTNLKEYGIRNYHTVINLTCNCVFFSLSRAIRGRENKIISTTLSHIEHQSHLPQKGGVLSGLKGMFKRR